MPRAGLKVLGGGGGGDGCGGDGCGGDGVVLSVSLVNSKLYLPEKCNNSTLVFKLDITA